MSSVLETFYILFDSDASKVKKGAQEATSSTKQLESELSKTDLASQKLGSSFLGMTKQATAAIAAALGVGAVVAGVFQNAKANADLQDLADVLGENVTNIDAWGAAVRLNGGSAEGFYGTLSSLSTAMSQIDVTGKSRLLPFFQELGLQMTDAAGKVRPVLDILPEMATAFEGLSKQEALGIGRKLGLDQGTILLLQQGRRAVDDLIAKQKELGAVTEADTLIAAKFDDQLDNTGRAFRGIYTSIGSGVLPAITSFLELLASGASWMRANSDVVIGFFGALAAVVTYGYLPAITAAAGATFVWAVALLAAFGPVALVIAGVLALAAGFALLYDDIMSFVDGGKSVTGTVVEWLGSFKQLQALLGFLGALWDYVTTGVENFIASSPKLQAAFAAVAAVVQFLGNVLGFAWSLVEKLGGGIGKIASAIGSVIGSIDDGVTDALISGKAALELSTNSPMASQTAGSISNSSRVSSSSTAVNTGPITVNTRATDGAGVADALGGELRRQMRQASSDYDDGVAR